MKRNVVRLLGLILSALIAVGAFVSCNKRETPTPEPKTDGNKVTEVSKSPSQTTERPEETTKNPEETTKKPEEPTKKPEEPTKKPEEPTKKPEEPTKKPEEPTKKPEETTVKPEDPPKPAATVTLSQSALTLTAGEKATLTAIVKNAEGMELKWSSSAPDVVSVDNGEILAQSAGTATITVSLPNGAFATCTIQVDPKPVEIGVYIDGTLVETLTTTGKNNYRITMPEKPEDITTDHNADRYFYGWFTDPSLNTPLTEEMTFPNGGKIYGKWIPINFSNYTYTVNYGKATITGAKQTTDTIVVIPSYINSFPVVEIAADVFKNRTMIRTLIICDGIAQIGDGAFYNCNSMINVTIPNSVTSIGNRAFGNCSSMMNIAIPDSVTSIGSYAFSGCTGLTSITLGNDVASIGSYAFSGCTELTSITVPDSVTSIGSSAFSGCNNLTSMTLPFAGASVDGTSDTYLGYIFGATSHYDHSVYLPSSLKTVVITKKIGKYAFYNCSGLTSITIPDSVTSIGSSVLSGCKSLTSMTIPFVNGYFGYFFGASSYKNQSEYIPSSLKTVVITGGTSISSNAFYDCNSLTSITIPDSVTSIGFGAFEGCRSLTSMTLPFVGASVGSTSYDHFGYIFGAWAYEGVSGGKSYIQSEYVPVSLKTVVITGGTRIGSNAFYDCSRLTSITIPDSVTSIGVSAFYSCYCLTGVYITDLAKWCSISFESSYANPLCYADRLYLNGTLITDLMIPDSVTHIGSYAFYGCGSLTSITIGNGVTSIGSQAFFYCSSLNQIMVSEGNTVYHSAGNCLIETEKKVLIAGCKSSIIPTDGSVTSIGARAFSGCSSLTSLTIPDGVTSIGESSFSGCSSLWSITIGNGVTSIGESSFSGCSSLWSITIGNGVTGIGEGAFYNCSRLSRITIGNGVTSVGKNAFYNCRNLTGVYITDLAKWCSISFGSYDANPLYYAHQLYLNGTLITDLVIPDSVTNICSYAFYGCISLTSITIPDSVTTIGDYAFYGCYKLVEVYNKSSLPISAGSNAYGEVGYRAKAVYTEPFTSKLSVDKNGYILYTDGDTVFLIGYTGNETSLILPTGISEIYAFAFYGCSSLTSITIPEGVARIGSNAFYSCSRLTSITIPNSVTSIGSNAFSFCSSLTSITIPDSVTSIGSNAFSGCSSLTSITFNGTKAQWNAISKGYNWNYYTGSYTVHCTDGDIKK